MDTTELLEFLGWEGAIALDLLIIAIPLAVLLW